MAGTASDPGGKRSGGLPQRRCPLKASPGEPSGVRGQERPCHPSRVSAGEGVSRAAAGSRGGGRPCRGRCVRRAGHTWGACCPHSLGWGGEPRGSGRSLLVREASSLGREAQARELADSRGMPPAPLPVMWFFIVGGLTVPRPLPADRKLRIRGLAPGSGGGRDGASSPPARRRPRSRDHPPTQPLWAASLVGPPGAPRVGLALRLLRRSVVPGRGPSLGVRFLTSRAGVSPVWALVAAQGHGGLTTCGTGLGPWDSVPVSVTGTVSVRRFPVCPGHPPSRGCRPFFGQREEDEAARDSCVVTPRRASSPGDPVPHSLGRGTSFTLAGLRHSAGPCGRSAPWRLAGPRAPSSRAPWAGIPAGPPLCQRK